VSEAASHLAVSLTRNGFCLSVDFRWEERVLVLFGPSGSGKSTLLETVLGLNPKCRARVRLAGETLQDPEQGFFAPVERRKLGWVPQEPTLFPHLDVRGNLGFGLKRAGDAGPGALARALEVLEIGGLLSRRVDELSGGERQRVALARAVASGPRALLLDEPLAALDLPLRARVLPYLLRVRDELGLPMLYITHDPDEAMLVGESVAVLDEGRIVASGPPREVLWSRAVRPLSEALGLENVLDTRVRAPRAGEKEVRVESTGGLVLEVPWSLENATPVRVGLRAEDIMLALEKPERISARNLIPGRVTECEPVGNDVLVYVDAGERLCAKLTAGAARRLALEAGSRVYLIIKAHALRRLG
jgi:molybdate transport system ATP-binding protein